jgi:hypothetical protein
LLRRIVGGVHLLARASSSHFVRFWPSSTQSAGFGPARPSRPCAHREVAFRDLNQHFTGREVAFRDQSGRVGHEMRPLSAEMCGKATKCVLSVLRCAARPRIASSRRERSAGQLRYSDTPIPRNPEFGPIQGGAARSSRTSSRQGKTLRRR